MVDHHANTCSRERVVSELPGPEAGGQLIEINAGPEPLVVSLLSATAEVGDLAHSITRVVGALWMRRSATSREREL